MSVPRFRAWIERYQKYMPVAMIHFEPILGKIDYIEVVATGGDWAKFYPEEFILEQYTGLKDKNGIEIYDGDIVKFNETICTVQFDEMYARYVLTDQSDGVQMFFDDLIIIPFEVVGKIHENPELLGEEE